MGNSIDLTVGLTRGLRVLELNCGEFTREGPETGSNLKDRSKDELVKAIAEAILHEASSLATLLPRNKSSGSDSRALGALDMREGWPSFALKPPWMTNRELC